MQVIDCFNDPYSRRLNAKKKRRTFEQLKRSNGFKHWKIQQLKIQEGKCAYCRILLNSSNIVTHIDHVQPLYYEGKNDFNNLVLSCRRCNLRKWISDKRVVPQWIRHNEASFKEKQRLHIARQKQHRQMKEILEIEVQEQIAQELSWIE